MRVKSKLLVSLILIVIVSFVYLNSTVENMIITAQNDIEDNGLVSFDNVTITTSFFATNLEISFTRYGGSSIADGLDLSIIMYLSLDNVTWIKTANYTFMESERESNVSRTFRFSNSILEPFPFDIEEGETLYVGIEYSGRYEMCVYLVRLGPLDIEIPFAIIRPWHFTMDWTLPFIGGSIFLCVFVIFLASRFHRKQFEKNQALSSEDIKGLNFFPAL